MESHKKLRRCSSASTEGRLMSVLGFNGRNKVTSIKKTSRPASAASRISIQTSSLTPVGDRTPSIDPNSISGTLPAQIVDNTVRERSKPSSSKSRSAVGEPDEVSSSLFKYTSNDQYTMPLSVFRPSLVNPLYERQRVVPSVTSTRASTPIWEMDGEKRVRFLEPEVTATQRVRPPSAGSTQSNIISNSAKFTVQTSQYRDLFGPAGHSARICNCPCHFFPIISQNVGIQVAKVEASSQMRPPEFHRLLLFPSLKGLDNLPLSSKLTGILVRCVLSQLGLAIVVISWCLLAALFFSTIEGQLEKTHLDKMEEYRRNLIIDLATELRQVRPFESVWRQIISDYLSKFENTILEAVRTGYGSTTPSWTFPDSFLYSVSLVSLLGPGGLSVQSPITRGFSLVFVAAVGPIMLLVAFNAAQSIREGLSYAWAWRRRRKQVYNADELERGRQTYTSERRVARPASGRTRIPGVQSSRVFNLEDNLPRNHTDSVSSSETSLRFPENRSNFVPTDKSSRATRPGKPSNSYMTRNELKPIQYSPIKAQEKDSIPFALLLVLPLMYIVLGVTLIVAFERKDFTSALYVTCNHLFNIDHGGIDTKAVFTSGVGAFFYSVFLLVGAIASLAFTLSIWPALYSALGEAGKNLSVVKPLQIYR